MQWLAVEKKAESRDSLKLRISGYITRAEELKTLLRPSQPPCEACESTHKISASSAKAKPNNLTSEGGEEPLFEVNDLPLAPTDLTPRHKNEEEEEEGEEEAEGHSRSHRHEYHNKSAEEREAWLREWEAALVAKNIELKRRERDLNRRERALEEKEKAASVVKVDNAKEDEGEQETTENDESSGNKQEGEDALLLSSRTSDDDGEGGEEEMQEMQERGP